MSIKLLSFDVWDTLIVDDSDEIHRAAEGLPSKKAERRNQYQNIYRQYFSDADVIEQAIDYMENAFLQSWKKEYKTPGVRWRLNQIEKYLGKKQMKPFILGEVYKNKLIIDLEEMELKYPILETPGAKDFLQRWSSRYPDMKFGIVSDAIYSPGRNIQKILDNLGMLDYFSFFSFSDEVGASKPAREIFSHLQKQANVTSDEIVHIGDRFVNDIEGACNFGAQAVLCQVNNRQGNNKSNCLSFDNYEHLDKLLTEMM
jgi:putative hydrolase of the HAD superfamily